MSVHAYTVTEITRKIKRSLEEGFPSVAVEGELSNVRQHTSGHVYFTLKDADAQISGVLWRSRAARIGVPLEEGQKVIVTGKIIVYEPRGAYQIETQSVRPLGIGELQMAYEYLRRKLSAEGLFDQEHKKTLPRFPERIGLVTSSSGAALHDILHVLQRRFPQIEVVLRPTQVQGMSAPDDISMALRDLDRFGEVDVIILARGGGSLEDLWAFNTEEVARAMFSCSIPIISAIGHEIDFTIADFVADLRAPTPSAAAEIVVRDRGELIDNVRNCYYTMRDLMKVSLEYRSDRVQSLLKSYALNRPLDVLRRFSQRIDELERGLVTTTSHRFAIVNSHAKALQKRLVALDPRLTLKRGYVIVKRNAEIVSSSRSLATRDSVELQFHDGSVTSKIT